jgi:hypothetical protein
MRLPEQSVLGDSFGRKNVSSVPSISLFRWCQMVQVREARSNGQRGASNET